MHIKNLFKLLVILIFIIISACSPANKTVRIEEFKSSLNCTEYNDDMRWIEIEEKFGEPVYAPIPTGQSLSGNMRIYRGKCIIFYTDLKKIKVEGKTRYIEVVYKIEICNKK
jgi:hypothetical protein